MVVLIKTVQLILALSILILVHEFGHFLFSKLFKARVEKFYLFFNPRFSIVRFKRFDGRLHCKFFSKNGGEWDDRPEHTEYGIGWIPFGGYCKISGMIDETTRKEDLAAEPQPWEFRTKSIWQRFLIMFGGVFFNFILAVVIFSGILYTWGESYLKTENALYGIATNELSREMGFCDGDRILEIDGKRCDNFSTIQIDILRSKAESVTVLRGEDTVKVSIDPDYFPRMLKTAGMFDLALPFVIKGFGEGSPNGSGALLEGDRIVGIGELQTPFVHQVRQALAQHAGESVTASVLRGDETLQIPVQIDTAGMMGVLLDGDLSHFFEITTREYSLLSAIPAGASKAWKTVTDYVKELGLIFTPKTEAYKSVGSFIAIGKIFPEKWDWLRFWSLCALFSIMLGVLNIIPIPGLDGGHILFLLAEAVTGRKPGEKFLEIAETIGMVLLMALMLLAFGNDIRGLFK